MKIGRYGAHAQFEWKLEDMWVGAFWRQIGTSYDLWICLVPCLPLHISWWTLKDRA